MQTMDTFARDDVAPSWWANALQKFVSVLAAGVQLTQLDATHIQVVAGADDQAAVLGIAGNWRWNEATVTRAHPGGAAGAYDVFVTAAANDITAAPAPGSDHTNYAWALAIVAAGATPAIVAGTVDIYRKIGQVQWDGAQITRVDQTVPGVATHAHRHATAGPDPLAPADIGAAPVAGVTGDFTVGGTLTLDGFLRGSYDGNATLTGAFAAINGGPLPAAANVFGSQTAPAGLTMIEVATNGVNWPSGLYTLGVTQSAGATGQTAIGIDAEGVNIGAGTIGRAVGVYAVAGSTGAAGRIAETNAVLAIDPTYYGGLLPTTAKGVNVQNQEAAGDGYGVYTAQGTSDAPAGHSWAFYGAGDAPSYLGGALTVAGIARVNTRLDVSAASGTAVATGTGLGDKIALYGTLYGFGVQTNRLVAYVPSAGAAFAVRQTSGSGNASSGADAWSADSAGNTIQSGNATITGTLGVTGATTLAAATATTPATADNSTKVATTAWVRAQGYALLASPTFTGTVTTPDLLVTDSGPGAVTLSGANGSVRVGATSGYSYAGAFTAINPTSGIGFQVGNSAAGSGNFPTFRVDKDGTLRWGPGGATDIDTWMTRNGANTVQVSGSFQALSGTVYAMNFTGNDGDSKFNWTGAGNGNVLVNSPAAHQSSIVFYAAGVAKWSLGKQTDDTFYLFSNASSKTAMSIDANANVSFAPTTYVSIGSPASNTRPLNVAGSIRSEHATNPFVQLSKTGATAHEWYVQALNDVLTIGDANNSASIFQVGTSAVSVGITAPSSSNGTLAVTLNSASGTAAFFQNQSTTRTSGYLARTSSSTTGVVAGVWHLFCDNGGTQVAGIVNGGQLYSTSSAISVISDQRLKTNVQALDGALGVVRALRPVRFSWREDAPHEHLRGQEDIGFIAQEAGQVVPHLAGEVALRVDRPREKHKTFAPGGLIPHMVSAIQELADRVETLEARGRARG